MRKKNRFLSLIALYTFCVVIYALFFLFRIENNSIFLILTIGSVAVLSTSTVYTVIHSKGIWDEKINKKKFFPEPKSIKMKTANIIEDYIDAMPLIEDYVESDESYKDMPIIDKYIFSVFSQDEINKINLLDLSKMDKILFIREMLYFDPNERNKIIENMMKNKDKADEEITYSPVLSPTKIEDQIRVYIRSLVEPGEKTKIIIIDTSEVVGIIKDKISRLFDYELETFLLSSGGIILDENSLIKDYDIDDDDEIALIPSRKERS
ncbi:MAG: hypothetical protein HWN81_18275 [Candidatus Lokiarchaeota archaeon]|nr:hypothetical protein [Candidatus Lokiarchaeota archaeon]